MVFPWTTFVCYMACLFPFSDVNFWAPVGIFGKQKSVYCVSCQNWLHRAARFAILRLNSLQRDLLELFFSLLLTSGTV